ncbi:MAG: YeeE/YedE family protein [bacterium]|nr:YeeE/YedE family protein [bacterium]
MWDVSIRPLLLGIPTGLIFGFVLQRGRFCMYTAFRDLFLVGESPLFRSYILALLVQMVLIHALAAFGFLVVQPFAFVWLGAVVGGFIFGVGITLAGGCASGSWYRVGEGMVGSWLAVIGFGLGVAATFWGVLYPAGRALRQYVAPAGVTSLAGMAGLPAWAGVLVFLAVGGFYLSRAPRTRTFTGWSWRTTGVAVGLVAAGAWVTSEMVGRHFGLSMTGPSGRLFRYAATGESAMLGWGVWMLIGVPAGALASAVLAGEFKWRAPEPRRMAMQFAGGILMGFGAATAGGCNIGNSLTGLATLSTGSLVATVFIMLGCWAGTRVFFGGAR